MKRHGSTSGAFFLSTAILCLLLVSACKKGNECRDVICDPCASSRLMIRYEDSTGACPASFHAGASIAAYSDTSFSNLKFTYNFSDSCLGAFLVEEDLVYVVLSGTWGDTIVVDSFEYQDPVPMNNCCFCYPVEHAHIFINDSAVTVEFDSGIFDSQPVVRKIN